MSLKWTIDKRALTVIGLNSGTSADAVDIAAVRVSRRRDRIKTEFLAGAEKKYGRKLRNLILGLSDSKSVDLDEVVYLDNVLGKFFGQAAGAFMRKLSRRGITIDLVASHGQTVRHLPGKHRYAGHWTSGSLQLGSLDMIAAATGQTVVGDFRQADVALGNDGAPITVGAMQRLFANRKESRLIVNIGGMSNYFYFPGPGSKVSANAADCGPGNSLCDILSEQLFSESFDRNGRRATAGKLSHRLLSLLLGDPFFTGRSISTGREQFGQDMARRIIEFGHRFKLEKKDLLRTAAELTTNAIALKVWPLVRRDRTLSKLYLTGGGRRNIFLVDRLRHHLPDLEVCLIDELGIRGDYVEAVAYAVMGEAALRSEPLLNMTTKAKRRNLRPILGRIVQPPLQVKTQR